MEGGVAGLVIVHSIMRQELLSLDTQKKALLSEAEAIVSELTTNQPGGGPPIGIDAPLVDDEGYPRADIDVYRARTLRKRFKEIQTDVKVLEKKIVFLWQEKLVAPLDATLKNVAKGTRKGKARDETTLQNKARKTKWTLS